MRAILEFNLPDDQMEYDQANAAAKLCKFIWDFEQYLRGENKYNDLDEKIIDHWFEMKDFDLDELYK